MVTNFIEHKNISEYHSAIPFFQNFIFRIWWVGVFMFGIAGSCFMVYRILNKFFTTPVLVALATKESTINAIPFPAVTICPEAKISSSCLNYTGILKARKGNTTVEYEINQ